MGRSKLHCPRKIQLFVKFSQLLMYLFISAWSGVRFLNPTGRPRHAMQREIIIFLYTFWTVSRVVGRFTSWMKNQREPSDGKEATREHGNCVSVFSAFSFTFKCCFPPHVTCYWEGCVIFPRREVLKEDESGSLKASVEEILFQSKRKRWVCLYMQRDETWFYCSTESFPLCAVESFYSVLCGSSAIQMF